MNAQPNQSNAMLNRSMPPGTIIPELVYSDRAAAVAWLCIPFGFRERLRIGNHRSQLVFGEAAAIVVVQATNASATPDRAEVPALQGELTHSLMVRVDNLDRHYAQVTACGARIISPPTDFPYGERQYTVEDIDGHRWIFSQSIADVDPRDWGGLLVEHASAFEH